MEGRFGISKRVYYRVDRIYEIQGSLARFRPSKGGKLGLHMNKPKLTYFKKEDILHLVISGERETNSVELSPNVTAELNENGKLIGIEILEASSFIRDSILEAAQAKILNLSKPYNT